MNGTLAEALVLAGQTAKNVERIRQVDVVLCPPAVFVYPIYDYLKARPRNLHLGLQNVMWEEEGAYTGENSLLSVKGICKYAIIGHSERRALFGETDEMVNKKTIFALKNNIKPIVCVGENERFHLEDHYSTEIARMKREGGILTQIEKAFDKIAKSDLKNAVVAYEPVWAIGTSNAADGAYAASVAYIAKNHIAEKFGRDVAEEIEILYGGSVAAKNVKEFMMQPDIDGLLVGGASIQAAEFSKICQISSEVKSGRII